MFTLTWPIHLLYPFYLEQEEYQQPLKVKAKQARYVSRLLHLALASTAVVT
jgi:hypothetical protein